MATKRHKPSYQQVITASHDPAKDQAYYNKVLEDCKVVTVRKMTPEDEKLFGSRRVNRSERISGVAGIEGNVNNKTMRARKLKQVGDT